ncbi:MAG: WbuC family cupin fold metalloprotein [Ignavibacteria bacterium]
MKQIDRARLDDLTRQALASPRKRMNLNLHEDLADPIQRLAIAMEPDTYIRPHFHRHSWELLIALRGRFVVLHFDDEGTVIARSILGEEASVVETPLGGWHAVLSLDPGAVIFEVKHGPYAPFSENDFAAWSPAADTEASRKLMAWFVSARVGERWPG